MTVKVFFVLPCLSAFLQNGIPSNWGGGYLHDYMALIWQTTRFPASKQARLAYILIGILTTILGGLNLSMDILILNVCTTFSCSTLMKIRWFYYISTVWPKKWDYSMNVQRAELKAQ